MSGRELQESNFEKSNYNVLEKCKKSEVIFKNYKKPEETF